MWVSISSTILPHKKLYANAALPSFTPTLLETSQFPFVSSHWDNKINRKLSPLFTLTASFPTHHSTFDTLNSLWAWLIIWPCSSHISGYVPLSLSVFTGSLLKNVFWPVNGFPWGKQIKLGLDKSIFHGLRVTLSLTICHQHRFYFTG